MNEEPRNDLAPLREELARLTDEVKALNRAWQQEQRRAGEAGVGAELLAARELVQILGWTWETASHVNAVTLRQLRLALDDHGQTWREFAGSPTRPAAALRSHLQRRAGHLVEGWAETGQVLARDTRRLTTLIFDFWRPFTTLLQRERTSATPRDTSAASREPW